MGDETAVVKPDVMMPLEKLQALRARMNELDLDVYIVPSDDPHLSGEWRWIYCVESCLLLHPILSHNLFFNRVCPASIYETRILIEL